MYKRNERADYIARKYLEYVRSGALENIAESYPNDFCYFENALYSKDMKIAYGYAVDGDNVWKIPDSVEIYDNLFFSGNGEDYYSLKEVYIEKNLKEIIDTFACFGMGLEKVSVSPDNNYYASIRGCLYSKDKKELILYPPMKKGNQFTVPTGTKVIKKGAINVYTFPHILIIPDSVEILEENWLAEQCDKGFDWTKEEILKATKIIIPRRFEKDIDTIWSKDSYSSSYTRPTIIYR